MNLTGRDIYQKGQKPAKVRKPMRRVSKKRARYYASEEGQSDLEYMGNVKMQPCAICGATENIDAHHCRCWPEDIESHAYMQLPGAGMKSHARDTIPLCRYRCHKGGPLSFHEDRKGWVKRNGPDYTYIPATRAAVAAMRAEIDF